MNALLQWAIKKLAGVNSKQWEAILSFVLEQAGLSKLGEDKKRAAILFLERIGIRGSTSQFLVESAVAFLKKQGRIE